MAYDITGAFEEIEMALITSMRNNMRRHINEEFEEGMNWSQWQAEVLSGLSQYMAENQEVLQGYMGRLNQEIDNAIREAYATGESEQEIEILKAIKRGYQPPKEGDKTDLQGRFFRINENKLNALVNATVNDMERAETSIFRMMDDIYRQIPFKAQMFYNAGSGSLWQCVDMATRDFLSSGINCVQYRNGARVNIASYVEMALRTANKRANLMGQAQTREKWGIHTVKVNARGIACPMCLQWLDKVYIDNVYGGGTAKESEATGYPLLSVAVEGGLYHPQCRDSCSTYYEGINREPREITDTEKDEILRRYNLEQKQRYYERNYRRNMRLGNGCIWQENADVYFGRAREYKNRLIELCENNPDVLRLDKQRLSLRGILSVDNAGRIEVPPKYKDKLNVIHTEAYNNLMNRLNKSNVDFLKVKKLRNNLSIDKIIERLAGGDMTSGSCASVGLAYVGNRNGLDVLDFRGGASQQFFSSRFNLDELTRILPEDSVMTSVARSYITSGNRLLQQVEQGREYYFVCGRHASIVRRNEDNVLQYLELQSSTRSGWTDFNANPRHTLSTRFGCRNTTGRDVTGFMVDVESFQDNEEFREILGYINTNSSEQRRGASGYAK